MKKEFVDVKREELLPTVKGLLKRELRLCTIAGVDAGESFEVLYEFDVPGKLLVLKVAFPKGEPRVPSISNIVPAATLYEREVEEMFGIKMEGHPSPGRLFLAENYSGDPPLLKKTPGGSSA
jgi:Ni,Fe-hydrogenase III component G